MDWTIRVGRWFGFGAALTSVALGGAGCLSRPVGTGSPTTKVSFTDKVPQSQIDKIDLLFAIDNSSSMKDKQLILNDAVPDLLSGLLHPDCEDRATKKPTGQVADPNATDDNFGCPANTRPAFKPISDMHIGIISSSLGTPGSGTCTIKSYANPDDHGHLIERGLPSGTDFLAWYPTNEETSHKDRHPSPPSMATTAPDFQKLKDAFAANVKGTDQNGCGLEAQLESVYRFLIQPDPWKEVTVSGGKATVGNDPGTIDTDLLRQRADFLRPDSLVAVIMLSDEDDSWVDPLTLNGMGYTFFGEYVNGNTVPIGSYRATSACEKDLKSSDCTSCGYAIHNPKVAADPNCAKNGGRYTSDEDSLNSRMFHMKQRFGIDPQYPIRRYVEGFKNTQVPDRTTEHDGAGVYTGNPKCTNPLFAAKLPTGGGDYCNLEVGARSPGLIFFADIGGVPNQLIDDLNAATAATEQKEKNVAAVWTQMIGNDPDHYDYSGQSVYMVQSRDPRPGLPGPAPLGDNGTDPVVGRDWTTNGKDLQYACTFALPADKVGAPNPTGDCAGGNAPLCNADGTQIRAKAYPTIRQLQVVHGLEGQGIAASLCPKQLTDPSKDDYGYKPAVKGILDRLKASLTQQCLPRQLQRDPSDDGKVPCLVLAKLGDKNTTCKAAGLEAPSAEIESTFREQERAAKRDATLPVCVVPQKAVAQGDSCRTDTAKVWCYVENTADSSPLDHCQQALIFSDSTSTLGATTTFSLQCIQQFSSDGTSSDQTSSDGGAQP